MTCAAIDQLISCQAELIRALDERDHESIVTASHALSAALESARWVVHGRDNLAKLEYAQKQSTALKIRINTLSEWNRQRIDRLSELRGIPKTTTYTRSHNIH